MKEIFILILFTLSLSVKSQSDISLLCSKNRMAFINKSISLRTTGNQNDFNLEYYLIEMDISPSSKSISANTTINCTSNIDNLKELDFDLISSLFVSKVTSGSNALSFQHKNNILKVFLKKTYFKNEKISIKIQYSGQPGSTFHFDTQDNLPMIWTLSEPYGSRDWWPCKNLPDDKIDSLDMIVSVPNDLIVASNGLLVGQDTFSTKIRYHWKERYPIASYLVSLAIHPYKIRTDVFIYQTDSMPVVSYIFPSDYDNDNSKYAIVPEMLQTLSDYYGKYPFIEEKYGNAQFLWGGGMEHQTLTSVLGPYEYLLVHELGHQWWGDMITCKDFHHIWLNEGFATYTEALWAEHKGGEQALHDYMENKKYLGHGTIYVEDVSQSGRIFSGALSYNKASWVLNMLRHVVGDSTFFEILHEYAQSDKKYDVAITEDFVKICNNVSGKNLDMFFDQWIYGDFHPYYLYDWSYSENNSNDSYKINLVIEQFQIENFFWMPIDIFIKTESGEQVFTIENNEILQSYSFDVDSKPLSLILDQNNWILCEKKEGINVINQDINNMILTVSSHGSFGYDKPDGLGNGLIYPKGMQNNLFYGSLMIGNSNDFVVDNSEKDNIFDFAKEPGSKINISYSGISDFDISINYNDSNHPLAKNLKVDQTSYAWFLVPYRNFVFIDYTIKNDGDTDLDNFFVGQFMDFDIGVYSDNRIEKDETRKMLYQYNDGIYLGIKLLNSSGKNIVYSGIIDAIDKLSENKKYPYLSGKTNQFEINKEKDWSSLVSTGPFNLNRGDSINITFAIIGGISKENIIENADIAQNIYNDNLTGAIEISNTKNQSVSVFPNPVNDKINFKINSLSTQNGNISIYDFTGRILYSGQTKLKQGNNIFSLNKIYHRGIYFYKISLDNTEINGKFIVN